MQSMFGERVTRHSMTYCKNDQPVCAADQGVIIFIYSSCFIPGTLTTLRTLTQPVTDSITDDTALNNESYCSLL